MGGKNELTDALIREVKCLLRNENQRRENFNHLTLPREKLQKNLTQGVILNHKLQLFQEEIEAQFQEN